MRYIALLYSLLPALVILGLTIYFLVADPCSGSLIFAIFMNGLMVKEGFWSRWRLAEMKKIFEVI